MRQTLQRGKENGFILLQRESLCKDHKHTSCNATGVLFHYHNNNVKLFGGGGGGTIKDIYERNTLGVKQFAG